ncbi:MAG: DUF1775 domain-containing protein [Acidobacteria bacterium]|nr:DUF1775 domain-containing protein [Acidobacteriota bacterium]
MNRTAAWIVVAALAGGLVMTGSVAQAHVTVWPQESQAGAGERYTVRVPTEGQVTTTSVELEIPADVTAMWILVGSGYTYETRREGDRIVAITWKQEIKPAEAAEYVFFARNPKSGQIAWKARQRFADGTSAEWIGVEGDRRPASVTRLRAAR